MADIKSRLVEELYESIDLPWECREYAAEIATEVVDVLLSLPGVVVVDLSDVDEVAKAIARNWPDNYAKSWPWSGIPERDKEAYRGLARKALMAAAGEPEG